MTFGSEDLFPDLAAKTGVMRDEGRGHQGRCFAAPVR
jgi:hypothetical protein